MMPRLRLQGCCGIRVAIQTYAIHHRRHTELHGEGREVSQERGLAEIDRQLPRKQCIVIVNCCRQR